MPAVNRNLEAEWDEWQRLIAANPELSQSDEFMSWTRYNSVELKRLIAAHDAGREYHPLMRMQSSTAMIAALNKLRRAKKHITASTLANRKANALLDEAFDLLSRINTTKESDQ